MCDGVVSIGAIKPTYIKSIAEQLLREVNGFSGDFNENKKLVEAYTNIESKEVRNRVAGYITRKVRRGMEMI
ncbi:30S ribosomal protein S17e [Candidatus Alkanophaga liquidiphilum]|nr:Ribosomal protein S17E [Candidatus Alkanophaga liquidiphilum]